MSMDRIRRWLPLVPGVAIVAGIIFLAVEIRQNTEAVIAPASTALTDGSLQYFSAGLDNQVVARAIYKQAVGEELDGLETAQLTRLLQYRRGYYERTEWYRYSKIIVSTLGNPIVRAMWEQYRGSGFTAL